MGGTEMEVYPIKEDLILENMKSEMVKNENFKIHFLFVLGINTGFRLSDLLRLTFEDLRNEEYISLKEKKTSKNRKVKINSDVKNSFAAYDNGENGLLFTSESNRNRGKALSRQYITGELKFYAELAGFTRNVGSHTMRKTFGYKVYQKFGLALTQKLLNHSNSSDTLRYIGIDEEQLDEAVESICI
jgi:site-specific recombinase XerD